MSHLDCHVYYDSTRQPMPPAECGDRAERSARRRPMRERDCGYVDAAYEGGYQVKRPGFTPRRPL